MTEPIESTPLGLARKAMDTAEHVISEAFDAWCNEPHDGPWRPDDISIKRDSESLGFVLVLDFNDGPIQPPESVVARLGSIIQEHGIARVECVRVESDSCDVAP